MTDRGCFVVLEGGEGAGKTTQLRLLEEWMEARSIPFTSAREPGGTRVGEAIREILLDRGELSMPPATELLLMLAARAAFVQDVVEPALGRGEVMLADRFQLSTFVYQGLARGLGLERTRELNLFATAGLSPDLTLVLDVPSEEAERRQRIEGRRADRIEGEGRPFMERVREGYRELAASDPSVVLVPGADTPEKVQGRLRTLLVERLPEPFHPAQGSRFR